MCYFDSTYFDPTYFDVCTTAVGGRGGGRYLRRTVPVVSPSQDEDEDELIMVRLL